MMKIIIDGITTHLYEDEKEIKNVTEIKFEHKSGSDPILIWKENGIFKDRPLAEQMDKKLKFKVGDKVRFKEAYLNSHADGCLKEYLGKVITIIDLYRGIGYYTKDNDENRKYWLNVDDVFELVEEDKKMKNIDMIAKDETLLIDGVCRACYIFKNGKSCLGIKCSECEFAMPKHIIDFLNAEYNEPKIKLTKLEYDVLNTLERLNMPFKYHSFCMELKNLGHFAGVVNTNNTMKYILNNCEVEE